MDTNDFYPPAPHGVPDAISRPDAGYRLRVVAMIGGLFLFLILYILLIAAAAGLAYGLAVMRLPTIDGRAGATLQVCRWGGAFAAVLLALFLLKGLFKGRSADRDGWLQLDPAAHPHLFAFIRRVYQDVGAPPPRRVYVTSDVNAALVYDTSLLNLVLPPKKDLLIGLGLVNVLDMAEFKAVMAHEFGHFAQRSVGLGSYLHVINQVLSDVIHGRDGLDRFVDAWARQDLRLGFPALGLKGVLWLVRQLLSGAFQGLNLLHMSLSRQLEYNADDVAVRLAGSDAIVHGLARLDFANECLRAAGGAADAAADHGLFSDDLFHHQATIADRTRTLRNEPRLGRPPELPDDPTVQVQVFQPAADGIDDRYRSHPTEFMRERNAKRFYIRSPTDTRSPWLLFGDAAGLRRAVSGLHYRHVLGRIEPYTPQPAADVQRFIDAELAERTFAPQYHGFYDDRFIDPGPVAIEPGEWLTREAVSAWFEGWPAGDLQPRMEAFRRRQGDYALLKGLQNGDLKLKGRTFPFRDHEHTAADVEALFRLVDGELDGDLAAFKAIDRQVYVAHASLARQLDAALPREAARETEIITRYGFHAAVESLVLAAMGLESRLQELVSILTQNPELGRDDFEQMCGALREVHAAVGERLAEARTILTPALTNVTAGTPLHDLIVDRADIVLPELQGTTISGAWLGKLDARIGGVLGRLRRVYGKSLGSLLACQEALAAELKGPG